jgi:hypothetical protein
LASCPYSGLRIRDALSLPLLHDFKLELRERVLDEACLTLEPLRRAMLIVSR